MFLTYLTDSSTYASG